MRRYFFLSLTMLLASSIAYAVISLDQPPAQKFITWDSLEPDKWSSIWLIKRYIDTNAIVEVRSTGDSVDGGIAFGVPQAEYKRSGNRSTFESLLAAFDQQDPTLQHLGRIITAIETTSWNTANDPLVHTIEQNFRRLQDYYGRAYVPIHCYAHFFDVVYAQLAKSSMLSELNQSLSAVVSSQTCDRGAIDRGAIIAERKRANRVKEIPIDQLLSEIALDKNVVFVDTREPAEFKKSHIPGAVNIPMRNLNHAVYQQLQQADRVISYCVKDFRGYEVARQMLDNGVSNVAVMKPHGLSGWQSLGLPMTAGDISEETNKKQLYRCAKEQQLCMKQAS